MNTYLIEVGESQYVVQAGNITDAFLKLRNKYPTVEPTGFRMVAANTELVVGARPDRDDGTYVYWFPGDTKPEGLPEGCEYHGCNRWEPTSFHPISWLNGIRRWPKAKVTCTKCNGAGCCVCDSCKGSGTVEARPVPAPEYGEDLNEYDGIVLKAIPKFGCQGCHFSEYGRCTRIHKGVYQKFPCAGGVRKDRTSVIWVLAAEPKHDENLQMYEGTLLMAVFEREGNRGACTGCFFQGNSPLCNSANRVNNLPCRMTKRADNKAVIWVQAEMCPTCNEPRRIK